MRKKVIAGNWKMFKLQSETQAYFEQFSAQLDASDREVMIFPPFTALETALKMTKTSNIRIGAQNMHFEDSGAYTGEISADMLKELGIHFVLIGHSERRKYFGETDDTVNRKVMKALDKDILPVVCIGEGLQERESGITNQVLRRQVLDGLKNIGSGDRIIIAYEPVWAIGTGKTATDEQAEDACKNIREYLREIFAEYADNIRILYGGSVNASNIKSLMAMPNIDGVLVGGASLKADFIEIVHYDR